MLRTSSKAAANFARLLPQMLPRLWTFALRISGNAHDAEKLVQLACRRALESSHRLRPGTSRLVWMFSILHSTWIDDLRVESVRYRSNVDWDDTLMEIIADAFANDPQAADVHAQIVRAVGRLPETQRTAMLLVAVEGFAYEEAADVLDVSPGTVMTRVAQARQAIGMQFETTGSGWFTGGSGA
jgi:RNA polymerase sigma-70 factor, ECF subfamily